MYNSIEVFDEPLSVKDDICSKSINELTTPYEQAFLCGLVKKFRPRKILEVGVAAGGSSAVLLKCIKLIDLNADLFSVDLGNESWINGIQREIGYFGKIAARDLKLEKNYHVLPGKVVAERLDKIGGGIDLVFLDTTHFLPGELLDFIAVYPYLSENAVVVLHDVSLNTHWLEEPDSYATKVLFDIVRGEKYVNYDPNRPYGFPNIAAFKIDSSTCGGIRDLFSALSLTWKYLPSNEQLKSYRDLFSVHYPEEYIRQYDICCGLQIDKFKKEDEFYSSGIFVCNFNRRVRGWHKHIYIFGAGNIGCRMLEYLTNIGVIVDGLVISEGWGIYESSIEGYPVMHLNDIPYSKEDVLILAGLKEYGKIYSELKDKEFMNVWPESYANKWEGYDDVCRFIFSYVYGFDKSIVRRDQVEPC